jgi:hypothetical protein
MRESFGNLKEEIGKALAPALEHLVKSLVPLINTMTQWIAQNPQLTK